MTESERVNLAQHIHWTADKAKNTDKFQVTITLDQPTAYMLADLVMPTTGRGDVDQG